MLLLFLNFLNATYNQLAISLDNHVITRVGRNNLLIEEKVEKKKYLRFENSHPDFFKFYHPKGFVNMESFFESDSVENLSFISKNEKKYKIEGLETLINLEDVFSLYIYSFLSVPKKFDLKLEINLACKDYLDSEKVRKCNKAISDLGYPSKAIPESLAVCLKESENFNSETPINRYYLNFRGSKVVGTLYEVSKKDDKLNIKMVESKEFNMKSDVEIENLIVNSVVAKINKPDSVANLPYEPLNDRKNFIFIKDYLEKFYNNLSGHNATYKFLEIPIFLSETGEKYSSFNDIVVSLQEIRDIIISDINDNLGSILESIPSNAISKVLSNIVFRKENIKEMSDVSSSLILQGLFTAFKNDIIIEDSRFSSISASFGNFSLSSATHEIELTKEIIKSLPKLKEKVASFKYITEKQQEEFLSLANTFPITFKIASDIKYTYKSLNNANMQAEAAQISRAADTAQMEKALKAAEQLLEQEKEFSFRETLENLVNETKEWFQNAVNDISITNFSSKIIKLKGHTSYALQLIKEAKEKAEELVKKELEAVADLVEDKQDDGNKKDDQAESADNNLNKPESTKEEEVNNKSEPTKESEDVSSKKDKSSGDNKASSDKKDKDQKPKKSKKKSKKAVEPEVQEPFSEQDFKELNL